MDAIYQLWGLTEANTDWDLLLWQLDRLQNRRPARAVVCGLFAPKEVYTRIIASVRKDGAAVYLWLPVFSELDDLADFDPLIDWQGRDFLADKGIKDFHFRCPASPRNREVFFADSLKHLQAGHLTAFSWTGSAIPLSNSGCPACWDAFAPIA